MIPACTCSSLERHTNGETIEVVYQTRSTIWDEAKQVHEQLVQPRTIRTCTKVPKIHVMLVGIGGNNGSTFVAGLLANRKKLCWETRTGTRQANFLGSFTQCATTHVGFALNSKDGSFSDVYKPIKELLPMADPIDFEVSGWDISGVNLYDAALRSQVLEPTLLEQLKSDLGAIAPMKAALNPEFIAANQSTRCDNVMKGTNVQIIDALRADIRKAKDSAGKVVVLWTANTEMMMFPEITSIKDLENRIDQNLPLPASVLYCVAAIQEGVIYLNGSPQNTFHPGVVELAAKCGAFLGGSDFKSGQTRFKTVMSDFLIGSGLRLASVVSYNHLGNNDGRNLSEEKCFKSKKISKQGALDDAVASNPLLYPEGNSTIDHEVVIKYVPFVGDSKRALDEYSSQIFMSGNSTICAYNICEDSLLAVPLMYDLVVLADTLTRMEIDGESLGPILSHLAFFFKAPITNQKDYVVNMFMRQREMLTHLLKVAGGILPDDGTMLSVGF